MKDDDKKSTGKGLGVCGVTFIVFLILKLIGVVTWSWWWVTAPLWMPVAAILLFLTVALLLALVFGE